MTLAELMVAVAIGAVVIIGITTFERDILFNNVTVNGTYSTLQSAEIIMRTMAQELRSISPGNDGSYPIVTAGTSTITFFTNQNTSGVKQRIRYFLAKTTLMKGILTPTGSPLTYNSANEIVTPVAFNVRNVTATSSIFSYYDGTYVGTSSPLVQPVAVAAVRLIRVTLTLDLDPNRAPAPETFTTAATLRNVKDNL